MNNNNINNEQQRKRVTTVPGINAINKRSPNQTTTNNNNINNEITVNRTERGSTYHKNKTIA
jgi:hypothetical protein